MSKPIAVLVALIVLFIGALIFIIGRSTGNDIMRVAANVSTAQRASTSTGSAASEANRARQGDGWNCDTHQGIADAMGLDGYRLSGAEGLPYGQNIETWRNIVPGDARKPGRDDVIRVQHSHVEDCVLVEGEAKNG